MTWQHISTRVDAACNCSRLEGNHSPRDCNGYAGVEHLADRLTAEDGYAGHVTVWSDMQLIVGSRLARRGIRHITTHMVAHDQASATLELRRGPVGWYARSYLRRHPVEFVWQAKTPDTDWQVHRTPVEVI